MAKANKNRSSNSKHGYSNPSKPLEIPEDVSPDQMFRTGLGYEGVARLLEFRLDKKTDQLKTTGLHDIDFTWEVFPMLFNEALAAEIYLKVLHLLSGRLTHGHDLLALYNGLDLAVLMRVKKDYDSRIAHITPSQDPIFKDMNLKTVLSDARNAFVEGRYWYERPKIVKRSVPKWFTLALRSVIIELKPEWTSIENEVDL